jgi:nucleoside-diphosphate-sugar epimerase
MRVLLTGHRGYIGTRLAPMLLERGHSVTGLDADFYQACTFGPEPEPLSGIACDVRDVSEEMLEGYEAVIHLAGLSNDPLGDYDADLTREINEDASVRLAMLAKRAGVSRYLFASSCSNYGAASDDFLDERAAFNPVTSYGHSKAAVERAVLPLADEVFSPTFLRASTAYGNSPRIRFDLVLNNLTAWAFTTGEVYLKSDGSPWRPLVHVDDIALAYIAVLEAPKELVHGRSFNIGSTSENYRVRELAEIVRDVVPGSRITFAADAGPDHRNYRVDCSLICRTLHDYKPQWTARRGALQLYQAFCEQGLRLEDFEGPRYKRISHIRQLIDEGKLDERLRRTDQRRAAG